LQAGDIGREIDPATGIEQVIPVSLPSIRAHHLMLLVTKVGFLDPFDSVPEHLEADVQQLIDTGVEIGGLRVVSVDWLRRMKTAAGRPKDLLDLDHLPPVG
jgi:hypothetical protein